jgi:hypothetical protein
MKSILRNAIIALIVLNLAVFVFLAFAGKLPADPKQLIFVDFWGRFCVYSLWFIGYALYRRFAADKRWLRRLIVVILCVNIPLFLGLGYFDRLSTAPEAVAVIDFWGRLTVYSLWFMGYEAFRLYLTGKSGLAEPTAGPAAA